MLHPLSGGIALLAGLLALSACAAPTTAAAPCGGPGIAIAPTATRFTDPDLDRPPVPPPADAGSGFCPTPAPDPAPAPASGRWTAGTVVNLALDRPGQRLAAAAMGDDMLAVAWLADGRVVVALARGGNHFQVRDLGPGEGVALAFSRANRLHVALAHEGQIRYRAADQGRHPADVPEIPVAAGSDPQVVVDRRGWAHVLYTDGDGQLHHARHVFGPNWSTRPVTAAPGGYTVQPFYDGAAGREAQFGLFVAAADKTGVRLFRYHDRLNLWQVVAEFPPPAGETIAGDVGLDVVAGEDGALRVTAAWVTRREAPPPPPAYVQPIFEPVNPLYPDAIANPAQIAGGLNAVRWRSDGAPFAAGLRQTVTVDQPGELLTFSARGLALTAPGVDAVLRIGIDPTGGSDPQGAGVIWSPAAAPADFDTLLVSAPAVGPWATLFLDGMASGAATVVWDEALFFGGLLENGGFEGAFAGPPGLLAPAGWTPYFQDGGDTPGGGRERTTIQVARSADGGTTWSGPTAVAVNRGADGSLSGAFHGVFPVLDPAGAPPTVSLVTIYAAGDPPPGSDRLRFGRPHVIRCEVAGTLCDASPGAPLLPPDAARPAGGLLLVRDPLDADRALLVWDALQSDAASHDVYATFLALRREEALP